MDKFDMEEKEAYTLYNSFFKSVRDMMKEPIFKNVYIPKLGSFWRYKPSVESLIKTQLKRKKRDHHDPEFLKILQNNLKSFE